MSVSYLRTVIVVDYQNIHLTGHQYFSNGLAKHEDLVHPLHFANQLLRCRNQKQYANRPQAVLKSVLVYRGWPSIEHNPDGYSRNQAQKAEWERDERVKVHLRPLKYSYEYDATGRPATHPDGTRVLSKSTPPREKGIDVLCALAVVREARRPDVDLVILASHDTDLIPALDEAIGLHSAQIETCSWYAPPRGRGQLRPTTGSIWNTRLGNTEFENCRDTTHYH